jgi:hypothetical protein
MSPAGQLDVTADTILTDPKAGLTAKETTMGLEYAIEELFATGWSALDTRGCEHDGNGRPYPQPIRVRDEFAAAGYDLEITHVQLFDCYRAEWRDRTTGAASGAVVGHAEEEAAVFALSQLRRQLAGVGV